MTQSDPSGHDGPARRGNGRPASTETVDKSGSTESAPTRSTGRATSGDDGAATQRGPAERAPRTSASASGSGRSSASTAVPARSEGSEGSKGSSGTSRSTPTRTAASAAAGAKRAGSRETTVRKPRRARLRLTQVDAWTVMKTSFLLSIALGIVSVVAVAIVWVVLGAAGVFDSMNDTVQTLLGNDFRVQDYIGTGRILGFTMILAVVDVVLLTAIATLAAFLYNLAATLLGGVEVTLTEDS